MPTPIPTSWKPIESAPTLPEFSDGLHRYGPNILVFAAGKVTIARWWQTLDGSASNFIDRGSCAVHPTHWMPLPAAPGADTPEEPITVALDPDPRGVSVGVWQGSHCIYHGAHAVPVAPGDAQDERQAFEAWMASQNLGFLRDGDSYSLTYARRAWDAWQARARIGAPAAGDAQNSGAVAALRLALKYWEDRQQRYKNRSPVWVTAARAALAATERRACSPT